MMVPFEIQSWLRPLIPMNPDLTQILAAVQAGEPDAQSDLLRVVYQDLRRMAERQLASFPPGQTLQPTALVHEAYMKLGGGAGFECRAHFFGAASRAMRNVLVDLARKKATVKHGGQARRVELHDGLHGEDGGSFDHVLDIDSALEKLEAEDERAAKIVEMRFFVGLSEAETAEALELSERTVRREWAFARAWLQRALASNRPHRPETELP